MVVFISNSSRVYGLVVGFDELRTSLRRYERGDVDTLSRRILQVEERLGVRLLNRSSRRFSVTEIGREFYDRCVAMLVEAEAAEQVIAQVRAEPRGVVRMSCPVALINSQFGALIARFMVVNPAVEVHLESTNRRVDVIAEGFDVAIRGSDAMKDSTLVARKLMTMRHVVCASPAYLKNADRPAVPAGGPARRQTGPGPEPGQPWPLLPCPGRLMPMFFITDNERARRPAQQEAAGVAVARSHEGVLACPGSVDGRTNPTLQRPHSLLPESLRLDPHHP